MYASRHARAFESLRPNPPRSFTNFGSAVFGRNQVARRLYYTLIPTYLYAPRCIASSFAFGPLASLAQMLDHRRRSHTFKCRLTILNARSSPRRTADDPPSRWSLNGARASFIATFGYRILYLAFSGIPDVAIGRSIGCLDVCAQIQICYSQSRRLGNERVHPFPWHGGARQHDEMVIRQSPAAAPRVAMAILLY